MSVARSLGETCQGGPGAAAAEIALAVGSEDDAREVIRLIMDESRALCP